MSRGWDLFFRAAYRLVRLFGPLVALWVRFVGLGRIVELWVPGRRSGRGRRVLLTMLEVGGDRYVGHPNGRTQWVRNLEAAGSALLVVHRHPPERVRPIPVLRGPERDDVIRATWTQQPPGANVLYRLARRHVQAVGAYFRLEPTLDEP